MKAQTANYGTKDGATGGYIARYLGMSAENDLQWQHVNVKKAGHRKMVIHCFSGEKRTMDVEVNGQYVKTLTIPARDWDERQTLEVDINLQKGDNTIRLKNANGWMPDIDDMTLED